VVRKGDIAMESGQQRSNLTKLSESDLPLEEPWQDIRRLDVYDITDEQIGSVEDLYVDREARQPRFLIVSAGGFLVQQGVKVESRDLVSREPTC
jgi:hypothetical protein